MNNEMCVCSANLLIVTIFRFDFSIPSTLHLNNQSWRKQRRLLDLWVIFQNWKLKSCEYVPHLHFLQRLQWLDEAPFPFPFPFVDCIDSLSSKSEIIEDESLSLLDFAVSSARSTILIPVNGIDVQHFQHFFHNEILWVK